MWMNFKWFVHVEESDRTCREKYKKILESMNVKEEQLLACIRLFVHECKIIVVVVTFDL